MIDRHTVANRLIESYNRYMADQDPKKGLVSAWLKVPGYDKMFYGRAYEHPVSKKWIHGERACIDTALDRIYKGNIVDKKLPLGCEMITTLEPCTQFMPTRSGCSCSELIQQHRIDRVYCGARDPWHYVDGKPPFHPFKLIMTNNQAALERCQQLFSRLGSLED